MAFIVPGSPEFRAALPHFDQMKTRPIKRRLEGQIELATSAMALARTVFLRAPDPRTHEASVINAEHAFAALTWALYLNRLPDYTEPSLDGQWPALFKTAIGAHLQRYPEDSVLEDSVFMADRQHVMRYGQLVVAEYDAAFLAIDEPFTRSEIVTAMAIEGDRIVQPLFPVGQPIEAGQRLSLAA